MKKKTSKKKFMCICINREGAVKIHIKILTVVNFEEEITN